MSALSVSLLKKYIRAFETVSSNVTYCHLKEERKGGGEVFLKHWVAVSVCDSLIPGMQETTLATARHGTFYPDQIWTYHQLVLLFLTAV